MVEGRRFVDTLLVSSFCVLNWENDFHDIFSNILKFYFDCFVLFMYIFLTCLVYFCATCMCDIDTFYASVPSWRLVEVMCCAPSLFALFS